MVLLLLFSSHNKVEDGVEPINEASIMGRIESRIPSSKLHFKKHGLGTFDYTMLMRNKAININEGLCELYESISKTIGIIHGNKKDVLEDEDDIDYISGLYANARYKLLEYGLNLQDTVDVLVAHMYGGSRSRKGNLWGIFGDVIFDNLKMNIRKSSLHNTISCDKCGKRIKVSSNNLSYCDHCAKEIKLEQVRNSKKMAKME